jgi:hypothetical protein
MPPTNPTLPATGQAAPRFYGEAVLDGQIQVDLIPVSFEAGETTTYTVLCPVKTTILGFYASVTKALAATDAGTITLIDAAGNTKATITMPLSSTLTTESTQNPTAFEIAAGSFYRVTWAKTTAGGKCLVTVTKRTHT